MSEIDDFLTRKTPAGGAPAPVAAGGKKKVSEIDAFLGPQARSAGGEIGSQLVAGAISELPKQVGEAMQYTGDKGDTLYDVGSKVRQFGEDNAAGYEPQPDLHNPVTNALAGGARMIAPSVAPAAAIAGIAALPAAAGLALPAAAVMGASALATGAVYGASQGQETYEKGVKAGIPIDQAKEAGRINALIEGGGETIGTYFGTKMVTGAGRAITRAAGRTEGQAALDTAKNTEILRPWLKSIPETAIVETGTEIGQGAGEAAIENAYGIDKTQTPYDAGVAAIAPTLGMTALLAPFGLIGHAARAKMTQQRMDTLADTAAPMEQRVTAASDIFSELKAADPAAAAAWRVNAAQKLAANQPITLDDAMLAMREPSPATDATANATPPVSSAAVDAARTRQADVRARENAATMANASTGPMGAVAAIATATGGVDNIRDKADQEAEANAKHGIPLEADAAQRFADHQTAMGKPSKVIENPARPGTFIAVPTPPEEIKAADDTAKQVRKSAFEAIETELEARKAREEKAIADEGRTGKAEYDATVSAKMEPDTAPKTAMQLAMEAAQVRAKAPQTDAASASQQPPAPAPDTRATPRQPKPAAATSAESSSQPPVASVPGEPWHVTQGRAIVASAETGTPSFVGKNMKGVLSGFGLQLGKNETPNQVVSRIRDALERHDAQQTVEGEFIPAAERTPRDMGREAAADTSGEVQPRVPPAGLSKAHQRDWLAGYDEVMLPTIPKRDASEGPAITVDAAAHEAATSTKNALPEPTDAQKEAGNYQKGHINVGGLDVSIENPAGSKRRPEWPALKSHYGYIRRTVGADNEHVDAFIKPGTPEGYTGPVFVVDQHVNGKFDEHKVMVGWADEAAARAGYQENYTAGWNGAKHVHRFTMDEFKAWLASGDTKAPIGSQQTIKSDKARIIPTREGVKVQALDADGKPIENPHLPLTAAPTTPTPPKKTVLKTPQVDALPGMTPLGAKPAEEKPAAAPANADAARAKADFDDALADLGDIFGKSVRKMMMPEQEQKLLPVLTRLFDAAFRMGYHEFKRAAKFVLDTITAKIGKHVSDQVTIDHLQGAYIGMAGRYPNATPKKQVVAVDAIADLEEAPAATDEHWWDKELTVNGRASALGAVGGRLPALVYWQHVDPTTKAKLQALRGTDRDPIVAENKAKATVAPITEPAQNQDAAAPAQEKSDDSTPRGSTAAVNNDLATGTAPGQDTARRGVADQRDGARRDDDGSVLDDGGRRDAAVDGSREVGDGNRQQRLPDVADRGLERSDSRQPPDFRASPDALTRKGSWFETAKRNVDIIELALKIDSEKRPATPEEQAQLALYVGFGAGEIRNALFPVPSQYDREREPTRLIWPNRVEARYEALATRLAALPRPWQESILRSTQYAHYTSANVVQSLWAAVQRLGFTGGKILEPGSGIGNFVMLMPDSVRASSKFTGVEFDGPTALIARLLSPQQNMLHDDFIKRQFPKDFFDVALGNPPFSGTVIQADPEYAARGFTMHDYFFAKSIDRVRPGGLLAFITSSGTMDKKSDKARRYLTDRADLIGAIRLPQTAFEKNAGTKVVTDVIFLRKRQVGEKIGGEAWNDIAEITTKDGKVGVNQYYAAHPEMVLGEQRISGNRDDQGRRVSGLRSDGEYTVISYDTTAAELDAKFAAAVDRLPRNVYSTLSGPAATVRKETSKTDFDPKVRREGVVYIDDDGDLMRVEAGVGVPLAERVKLSAKDQVWLKGFIGLRGLIQDARADQFNDGAWEKSLKAANRAYDAFRKKHGPILEFNDTVRKSVDENGEETETITRRFKNKRLFREDYDATIVTQLEQINDDGDIIKAKFLSERTIKQPIVREVKSVGDALGVSLDEIGSLDLPDVAKRLNLSLEEAIDALGKSIYKTPAGQWQLADEYLSGDVVTKLKEAIEAARLDKSLERNVEALKEAQPEKLGPSQISVKLGASWVPVNYINEFSELIGAGNVDFHRPTESWQVEGGRNRPRKGATAAEYGTAKRTPANLLEAALNSRSVVVKMTISGPDGRPKEVTDVDATTAATEMVKRIKDRFRAWVWADAERAGHLVELYNDQFNNIAGRKFDGSHLSLPGLRTGFHPHPHQLRAVWRQIQTGDTYLAHAVGAGKTFEMIAGGMEQKRLGLIQKPIYVVPNHMLEQFGNEFMEFYPLANIMVADDENFTGERRRSFVAAAALNAPDAIIITHSAFERIGVKAETVTPIRDEMLAMLQDELDSTEKDERVRRGQLEKQIENMEQRFDRIIGAGSKDSTLKFEDLGADFIYADEAHKYRKLDFATNQQVKGIDPNGSRIALDMYVKTRWLEKQRPGRAMVFASGTPVTNTMGELYTLMRFFAQREMERAGVASFDGWARQFGDARADLEANATGRYEMVTRFAKFENIPELMSRVRQFMDVLTSSHLGASVKRPDMEGGHPHTVTVPALPQLKHYMDTVLAPRLVASRAFKPRPGVYNPDPVINIITDGRLAALDPRFFGAKLEAGQKSKLMEMGDRIIADYKATADNTYLDRNGKESPNKGAGQIVFYNAGFGDIVAKKRGFDARSALTKQLVAGGIKKDHILWFDDADSDAKKEAMFKRMRSGESLILIGSAKKMGTGVNVQDRLRFLHYFDPPWFPADVEQPHGRAIRQKNQNELVRINWYATKGTYDSTMWQMVARKQRFIDQAFSGDKNLRTMDDIGEASQYEQAAAAASGDPRAIQLAGLRSDVERLERLQAAHANEQVAVRTGIGQAQSDIGWESGVRDRLQAAAKALDTDYVQWTSATVAGRTYNKVGEFGAALRAAFNQYTRGAAAVKGSDDVTSHPALEPQKIGEIAGQPIMLAQQTYRAKGGDTLPSGNAALYVKVGPLDRMIEQGENLNDVDETGLGRRVINNLNEIDSELSQRKRNIAEAEILLNGLNKKRGAPFEYQQEMLEKHGELRTLEEELRAEGEAQARADAAALAASKAAAANPPASGNVAPGSADPADRVLYGMVNAGASAPALLRHIAKSSSDPLRARIAELLLAAGISPKVGIGAIDPNVRFVTTVDRDRYTASYTPETDTVTLHRFGRVERDLVHEFTHAATEAAIERGGIAARQLIDLFTHAKGFALNPNAYGWQNVKEFIAEAFSNPKFQDELKAIPAQRGVTIRNAWEWFVNAVRMVLGLGPNQNNALAQALEIGQAVVTEGIGHNERSAGGVYANQIGPLWYSALNRAVASQPRKTGTAAEWAAVLPKLAGVKPEELEWSGVMDWLELQPGKVSRDALQEYLGNNGVKVTETLLGDGDAGRDRSIADETVKLDALGFKPIIEFNRMTGIRRNSDGMNFTFDEQPAVAWRQVMTTENVPLDVFNIAYNLSELRDNGDPMDNEFGTRFDSWVLPGGENYKELLLTLPERPDPDATEMLDAMPGEPTVIGVANFHSSHFNQPNIVAHVRFNERIDAQGRRVLFVEEIQSDWAQEGRREGFGSAITQIQWAPPRPAPAGAKVYESTNVPDLYILETAGGAIRLMKDGEDIYDGEAKTVEQAKRLAQGKGYTYAAEKTPAGPFVQKTESWTALAIKRVIRYAAEHGFDRVAFANGQQNADRYHLSKTVDKIVVVPRTNAATGEKSRSVQIQLKMGSVLHLGVGNDGNVDNISGAQGMRPALGKPLAEVIGKDLADLVMKTDRGTFEGDGLRVGGKGMIAFYDKIVPNIANDILKKIGGDRVNVSDVGTVPISYDAAVDLIRDGHAVEVTNSRGITVVSDAPTLKRLYLDSSDNNTKVRRAASDRGQLGFDITPAMRDTALEGMPLFNVADLEPAAPAQRAWSKRVSEHLQDLMKSQKTMGLWGSTVGTMRNLAYAKQGARYKHPDFKRVYDLVQDYLGSTSRFAMRSSDLAPSILPRTDNIAAAGRNVLHARSRAADVAKVQDAIWTGTLTDNREYGAGELEARFHFTPSQVAMYREARAAIGQSVRDLASTEIVRIAKVAGLFQEMDPHAGLDALARYYGEVAQDQLDDWRRERAELEPDDARAVELTGAIAKMQDTMLTIEGLRDDAERLLANGYAPLMRFGRYVVDAYRVDPETGEIVRDAEGNADRLSFQMFDHERHANAAARELKREFASQPDVVVVQSVVNPDAYKQFQGMSPETLSLFADRLGLTHDETFREYLKLAVSQRSALQRMHNHRKGIAGFSEDLPRVLAAFITSNSRRDSTNIHEGEISKAVTKVRNGEEQRLAQGLSDYVRNPTEEAQKLRGFLFFNFLSGSIASAITNTTGGVLMLAPYLHQFTAGRRDISLGAIMASAAKMATMGTADPEMQRAALLAAQEGLTQPMETHQLHAEAAGSALGRNPYLRSALHVLAAPFSAAETFNRRLSFFAAYQIAKKLDHPDPMRFAAEAIAATQGVYNKGNRPVWARGALGATVFTFKQFAIAYGEFLMRLPVQQRAIALAVLVAAAGVRGIPFEEDLEDLIDTIAQALGFNFTTRKKLHEWAAGVLGETGAQIALNGFSAIPGMPLDVQSRLGFGNMIPGTSILKRSETDKSRDALEAVGPVGGFIKNVSTAAGDVFAGNVGAALKHASPLAVQNMMQAIDMATTGYYNDAKGRRVAAVDFGDAAVKAIGFQPATVAAESRKVQEQYQGIALNKTVESDIVQKWAEGIQTHDSDRVKAALADLREWNAKNPEAPIRITPSQVQARVKEMNLLRAQRFAKSAPPELRSGVQQALR